MLAYFGWYLLKVSICIIVFYTFYHIALRNTTFFRLNRLYLVLCLALSFILPVLNFSILNSYSPVNLTDLLETSANEPNFMPFNSPNTNHASWINFSNLIALIYCCGVLLLFFKLIFSIFRINRLKQDAPFHFSGNIKIVKLKASAPFSFFNTIYLPENENNTLIIEHEMAHIRQFHWFDLVLTEIACSLLWFNPFLVLYKRSLKLQHEYLADSSVVADSNQLENYLNCMLNGIYSVGTNGLTSQFYFKTFKKRINMITKDKTSIKYKALYLLLLPLIGLLLFAFTGNSHPLSKTDDSSAIKNEVIPSIYPIEKSKITQVASYGERMNPITKKKDFHRGIDFAVKEGEAIKASADGVIAETNFDSRKGNYILIKHNDTYSTFYSHLMTVLVKEGEKVAQGKVIGYAGNTGSSSTGPHLHYEVIKNGKYVDPKDYLKE